MHRTERKKRKRGGEPCIFAAFAPLMASVCFSQFVRYRWSPGIHRYSRVFSCPVFARFHARHVVGCTRRLEETASRGEDARTNGGHRARKTSVLHGGPPLNANEREAKQSFAIAPTETRLSQLSFGGGGRGATVKAGAKLIENKTRLKRIYKNLSGEMRTWSNYA